MRELPLDGGDEQLGIVSEQMVCKAVTLDEATSEINVTREDTLSSDGGLQI